MLSRTARLSICAACQLIQCQRQRYVIRYASSANAAASVLLGGSGIEKPLTEQKVQKAQNKRDLDDRPFDVKYPAVRTGFVRFWEPLRNIADVWASKRTLEKRYGAILEMSFLKDFEVPNKYQLMAFVIFRDLESMKRIPITGEEFTLYAPQTPKDPHELGIQDMEQLVGNYEYQSEFDFDNPERDTKRRVIGGHIKRSDNEFCDHPLHRNIYQATSRRHMENFLTWGGFSNAPMDTSRRVSELDLFSLNARDEHARMRAALQLCSDQTSLPIPQRDTAVDQVVTDSISADLSPETARVFAGLYSGDLKPTLGRQKRSMFEQKEKPPPVEDKVPISTNVEAALSTQPLPSQLPSDKSTISEDSPPLSPESSSLLSPKSTPEEPKRPTISVEEKEKLESQLNTVRMLQKATTPARKKQPKPPVEVKKPKARQWIDEPAVEEVKPEEKKGFLSNFLSLFGR